MIHVEVRVKSKMEINSAKALRDKRYVEYVTKHEDNIIKAGV